MDWRNFDNSFLRISIGRRIAFFIGEKRKEKRDKRRKLEGYLEKHSADLVNEVLRKWFDSESVDIAIMGDGYCYSTPLANAYYEPRFKSRIMKPREPQGKIASQAIEHLKEYPDEWALLDECKSLTESHLKNVVKLWESIEKKLVTSIPARFTEWNARGVAPPYCYILENTVREIYREAELFVATGKFEETLFKKNTEKDYFRVGMATLYAKSSDESLVDEFISIVCGIVTDSSLAEQLKLLDAEKKAIGDLVEKFRRALDKITDDFEKGHINLKGICWRCKPWYDELASLG